jgi:hypothetical protein
MKDLIDDTTPQLGGNLDPNKHMIGPAAPYDLGNMGATPTVDFGTNGYWQKGTVNASWTSALVLPEPGVVQVCHLILVKSDDAVERTVQFTGVTWTNNDTFATMGTVAKARFFVNLTLVGTGDWIGSYSTAGTG